MAITGELTRARSIKTTTFTGEFETRPDPISYGQGGRQQPDTFILDVVDIYDPSAKKANMASYVFRLSAKQSRTNNVFTAAFGFPSACRMNPNDYGYGYAGLMHEVSEEVLVFVSDITGVDLLEIADESRKRAEA